MIKSRFAKTVLLSLVVVCGMWALMNRDKISNPDDVVQLISQKLSATAIGFRSMIAGATVDPAASVDPNAASFVSGVVRLSSFRLNPRGTSFRDERSLELIADICRHFDAIAIQQIDASDTGWLDRLVDRMNRMGAVGTSHLQSDPVGNSAGYAFIVDKSQNPNSPARSAIVYNRQTLEFGQSEPYIIDDPDRMLGRQPLVGWFRARGPEPSRAFTFTLVNLQIDSHRSDQELAHLGELYRAIREDGRMEDDIILLGDFNSGDEGLEPLKKQAGLTWAISNQPTNIQGTLQFDNLVFGESATTEFTGRSGVDDFMRIYNLTLDDAKGISERMPVWAEFSIYEGGLRGETQRQTPGRVAKKTAQQMENSVKAE